MHKHTIFIWASALVLAGGGQMSCTKHDPVAELVPAKGVSSTQTTPDGSYALESLLAAMAADPLVQANHQVITQHAQRMGAWFDAHSEAENDAYMKQLNAASTQDQPYADPGHTVAEQQAYDTRLDRDRQLIRAKYPQLAQLSPEDFGQLYAQLADRFDALPK